MTNITCTPFFLFEAGQSSLYTLKNQSGMAVSVTDWGAYLVSVLAPDRSGRQDDVILSYNDAEGFFHRPGYYGATVGRNCNRIGGAQVELGGKTYHLPQNDHGNNLHSGPGGLDHIVQPVIQPFPNCYTVRENTSADLPGSEKIVPYQDSLLQRREAAGLFNPVAFAIHSIVQSHIVAIFLVVKGDVWGDSFS